MRGLIALLVVATPLVSVSQASAASPDIVVFPTDDQSQLDATPYGARDLRTPHLQRLADAGLTFTRALCRVAELRGELDAWLRTQDDRLTVVGQPRLLSDPLSHGPAAIMPAKPSR